MIATQGMSHLKL